MTAGPKAYRISAWLLGLYAVIIVAYAAFNDLSSLTPRYWMRLLFVGVLIYGLLRSETWARWLAVAYGLVMGAAGLFGVWAAHRVELFSDRAYPTFDYAALIVSSGLLIAAGVALLRPKLAPRGL